MTPGPVPASLAADDLALLERVAKRIVELRLEVPAILTLETGRPLSVLAAQSLYFFEPLLAGLLRVRDLHRFARLIEQREAVELLIRRIEGHADQAHSERREAAAARRAARVQRSGRR
jgi:hypothetical protein